MYKLLVFAIPLLIGSTSVAPLASAPLEELASLQKGQLYTFYKISDMF